MGERGSKHSPPPLLGGGAGEVWLSLLVQEGCDWSCGFHFSSLAQVLCVRCVHVYTIHMFTSPKTVYIPLTKTFVSIYMYVCV